MNLLNATKMLQTADLTMSEKAMKSAEVVLTGFVVVFAVLLLLILIIKIYSTIVVKVTEAGQKTKKDNKKVAETNSVPVQKPIAVAQPAQPVQDGISEEVVAVISAAVATMYGPQTKTRIKSIKKSNGGRNAWANAGVLENTRPF